MTLRISTPMKIVQWVDFFSQEAYMNLACRILTGGGVNVRGRPLWISASAYFDAGVRGSITVGDRCVISGQVMLLTHDFSMDRVAELKLGRLGKELTYRGPISIGDYVFVGLRAIVLPGVSIGRGSIVGSGSIVTRDVPEGVVVAGNPAQIIGTTDEYWERSREKFTWTDRRK